MIHLITSLPLFLNSFIKNKTKIILRISGFPQLNYLRKYFWKFSGRKIYKITCPSVELEKQLIEYDLFDRDKVLFLADPIIRIKEFITKISKIIDNQKSSIKKIFLFLLEDLQSKKTLII